MSTKIPIRHESGGASQMEFHLYTEAFDEGHVYLETVGFPFEASILQDLSSEKGRPRIVIKFPINWAKKLKLIDPQ